MASDRKAGSFLSHAATYAAGNFARRIVGFAMLPIYTQFLTPADYGVIGLLTFALGLFEPIFGARMGRAIPKFYFDATDGRGRREVIWGAVGVTTVVSALTMTVLMLFRGTGSEILFGNRKYALALGLFAVNLLSRPLEQVGFTYLRLRQRSGLFFGTSMMKLVLQVALNLLLVVSWKYGVIGAVLSGIISSVAAGVLLMSYVAVQEAPALDWQLTRQMFNYCWPLWLSGLAGLYIGSSGGMYLRLFDSLSDVGRLELALKFATVASALFWGPFFQHWEPMSYRYYKEEGGRRKFQVAFTGISTLLFAAGLGVSIYAQPVIALMAAKPYYAAAGIVPILALAFVLNSLKAFFNFSFLVTGRTKIHGLCQYVTAVIITVCYVGLVPRFGLVGAAGAQCVAMIVSFIYVRQISRRYYDPGFSLAPIAAFVLIGIAGYSCSNLLVHVHNLGTDLLIKSFVLVVAVGMMVMVGIRAIRAIDATALEGLPWPLHRLNGVRLERQSGA